MPHRGQQRLEYECSRDSHRYHFPEFQICPGSRIPQGRHAVGRLNAAIAEQVASVYADLAAPVSFSETVHASRPRYATWSRIKDILSRLDPGNDRSHLAANALASCFARKQIGNPNDADRAFSAWVKTDDRLTGAAA